MPDNAPYDNDPPQERVAIPSPNERDRCVGCGQFLRRDSYYVNRCADCWTPEDEFIF